MRVRADVERICRCLYLVYALIWDTYCTGGSWRTRLTLTVLDLTRRLIMLE